MTLDPAAEAPHRRLLRAVARDLEDVIVKVAADVGEPAETVAPAVGRIVDALLESDELTARARAGLTEDAAHAATAGVPLPALLDRYLSTGWVLLDAAAARAREAGTPDEVARLGAVLLRAGDAAAAALSEGYGRVERERTAIAAAARTEFLDELLSLPAGDATAIARVTRRAGELDIDPAAARDVFVVGTPRPAAPLPVPALDALARRIVPPPRPGRAAASLEPLVALRRDVLVVVAPAGSSVAQRIGDALAHGGGLEGAVAIRSRAGAGIGAAGAAYVDAMEALRAAGAASSLRRDGLVDAEDLLLERAILATGDLGRSAVSYILGPIRTSGRGGDDVVDTLRAFLVHRQNVRATARALGIAPRTVTYRLSRAEQLLGRPLEGEMWIRIATALFADAALNASGARL